MALHRLINARLEKIIAVSSEQDKKLVEEITKYQKLYKAEVASNLEMQSKITARNQSINSGMVLAYVDEKHV